MAVDWNEDERRRVEQGIQRHPVESGRCAALARVVFNVGRERDENARGRHLRPRKTSAARFVVPKHPHRPRWGSHTFVEAHDHAVDALTGVDGCESAGYLDRHWEFSDQLDVEDVDVETVDPGIQDVT